MKAARAVLSPELYNRIDEILYFGALGRDDVREVARRQLTAMGTRLFEARGVRLSWSDVGIDALLDRGGYDPSLGARPVKRAIARLVEAPMAEMLLRDQLCSGDVLHVGATADGEVLLERAEGDRR